MSEKLNEQMVMGTEAFDCGVQKRLVHAGLKPIDYFDGTKVYFHYKTIDPDENTTLDDSKKMNETKPMELIIGKKFKLEVWEKALKTMWLNEVARFSVVKELLFDYPVVAKQLREYYGVKPHSHNHHHDGRQHCCGFNLIEQGVGFPDLDSLLKNPKPLDFIFELIKVEQPGEYEKEKWILTEDEQIKKIPLLKEQGNDLFKSKNFSEASLKYEEALGYLEQLMLKEKPNDIEWNELNNQKIPILLNYSLCKFQLNDYYSCIEHCNTILEYQKENVKALFRRAKANMSVWNLNEAKEDFNRCKQIDPTLTNEVNAQLDYLVKLKNKAEKEEMEKFKGKLFN